ncbi:MAG: porin family protein [Pseudomonadota bacterium]|nr:porin family protein [Pseudomonadota bacterium]
MKKLLLLSTVCLLATSALAMDVKPYVEAKGSYNRMNAEVKVDGLSEKFKDNTVWGGSLEVGAKVDLFRIGLEGYYNDKLKDNFLGVVPVEGETKGFFLNGYFDIPLPNLKQVKPYVGAGIGYSWLKETVKLADISEKDNDWGWNVGLGVGYALNDNLDLTIGYRYEYLGEIKKYDTKTEFKNSKVSLGLRYTF